MKLSLRANLVLVLFHPNLPKAPSGKLHWAQNCLNQLIRRWITGIKKPLQAPHTWWAPAQVVGTPGVSKPRSDSLEQNVPWLLFPIWPGSWLSSSPFFLFSFPFQFPVPHHQLASGIKRGQSRAFWASDSFQNQRGVSFPECSPPIGSLSSESTQNTEGPGQSKAWESLTFAPFGLEP